MNPRRHHVKGKSTWCWKLLTFGRWFIPSYNCIVLLDRSNFTISNLFLNSKYWKLCLICMLHMCVQQESMYYLHKIHIHKIHKTYERYERKYKDIANGPRHDVSNGPWMFISFGSSQCITILTNPLWALKKLTFLSVQNRKWQSQQRWPSPQTKPKIDSIR